MIQCILLEKQEYFMYNYLKSISHTIRRRVLFPHFPYLIYDLPISPSHQENYKTVKNHGNFNTVLILLVCSKDCRQTH